MLKEHKVEIVIDSPTGEQTYDIWDRNDLKEVCLKIIQERLNDGLFYYPDNRMLNQLTYAVDNDLGELAYKFILEARDKDFPYSAVEFIDEEGNGEETYETLTEDWSLEEEEI